MVDIDKGVPVPEGAGRKGKYPWKDMKVGDSIYGGEGHTRASLLASATGWATRNNPTWRFTSRKDGAGYRIWRVEDGKS